MLGEREAAVRELRPVQIHGARYVDVTLAFVGEVLETARLGPESIPTDLRVGERVIVGMAMNVIVEIHRP